MEKNSVFVAADFLASRAMSVVMEGPAELCIEAAAVNAAQPVGPSWVQKGSIPTEYMIEADTAEMEIW